MAIIDIHLEGVAGLAVEKALEAQSESTDVERAGERLACVDLVLVLVNPEVRMQNAHWPELEAPVRRAEIETPVPSSFHGVTRALRPCLCDGRGFSRGLCDARCRVKNEEAPHERRDEY